MKPSTISADVIVVGGGHNGLICAAYLARAGINTLLIEARDEVGGCASTVSDLGARFNVCNCDHTMVRAMPIIDELDLESHGLNYLEADASIVNLFYDGAEPWPFFSESERVLDALSLSYPSQVAGYRRYLADAMPVVELVVEMARTKPSTSRMVASALRRRASGAARMLDWSRRSVDDVFADYFDDWHITMPAISTGPTVWGVTGSTPGTGLAATSYALRHLVKTGRPEGGSGQLTEATRASFEAAGGQVMCGAFVERLLIRDGHVHGVQLTDGTELQSSVVVAACDPQRVFVDWVDEPPAAAKRMIERWRALPVSDGYESKVDGVMATLPRYRAIGSLEAQNPDVNFMESTMVISPSPDQLEAAHVGRLEGRVAEYPTMLSNIPSVLDPTMRTKAGDHVLSLEVLYTPYALKGGWPGSSEPQRWIDRWAELVEPGAVESISASRAMTPDRYEQEFSMHRGHTPSYGGSPLVALLGRQRELTRYRSPIAGLYLSGAGTFPGAGVFGAAGRNTADVVRRDLKGPLGSRLRPLRNKAGAVLNARSKS